MLVLSSATLNVFWLLCGSHYGSRRESIPRSRSTSYGNTRNTLWLRDGRLGFLRKSHGRPWGKMMGMRDVGTTVSLNRWHHSEELFPVVIRCRTICWFCSGDTYVWVALWAFFCFPSFLSFLCCLLFFLYLLFFLLFVRPFHQQKVLLDFRPTTNHTWILWIFWISCYAMN